MFRFVTIISVVVLAVTAALLPRQALAQAAPGTPQKQTATLSGIVLDSHGKPIAGAQVRLRGLSTGNTTTDYQGTFEFDGVAFGEYSLSIIASGYGLVSRDHIAINSDSTIKIRYSAVAEQGLKTIAEVSTAGRASINVTPASITTIDPAAYAFEGQTSWHQVLEQLPGVNVGGNLQSGDNPSLYVPESPFFPAQLSINGTLPYETATLLDGMPLHLSSFFGTVGTGNDISALPMNSFSKADIVRGPGADSPSIVGSVGGSFDFHAPANVYRNTFEFSTSTDAYGGFNSNMKLQAKLGRLSATVVYGINDSPGPVNRGEIAARGSDLPGTINGHTYWCNGYFNSCVQYLGSKYSFQGTGIEFDHFQVPLLFCCVQVSSAWSAATGSIGLSYQIAPQVTAQVFYAGSTAHANQFAPFWQTTFSPGSLGTSGGGPYSGSVAPGTYNLMSAEYNNFASEATSLLEEKVTANFGNSVLRVAAAQTYSNYLQDLPSSPPAGNYQLWGTTCYGSPPSYSSSGPGKCTPVTFNGTYAYLTPKYPSYISNVWGNGRDLSFNYTTQFRPDATFGLSYVTSYYNYPYEVTQGSFNASQPPSISNTTDETRAYLGFQPSDRLSLDASWYFAGSDYHVPNPASPPSGYVIHPSSWVDSVVNYNAPRLGLVYRAGNDVALRAAAGGGFALAPLYYLIGTNGQPSCSGGFCTAYLTNTKLQPETSFGYDIGSDARFHNNTVLSVDLYHTNLWGQIFQSPRNDGTFHGQPLIAVEYQNLNQSVMEGINASVKRDVPRGVYWNLGLGLTRGYIVSVPPSFYLLPGCKTPCVNTTLIPGINFTGGDAPGRIPYANGNGSIGYRWGPNRFIEASAAYLGNNNSYFVRPFVAFDLRGGYSISKSLAVLATFENITCQDCGAYAINTPSTTMGIPAVAGTLPWQGLPAIYSPRALLVTLKYQL